MEEIERPSFENFLSKPTNLTDHLAWQLAPSALRREVREAAEQIIGNLNEDGYLIASDEEMLGVAPRPLLKPTRLPPENICHWRKPWILEQNLFPPQATSAERQPGRRKPRRRPSRD